MDDLEIDKIIIGAVRQIVEKFNGECNVLLIVDHEGGIGSSSNMADADGPRIQDIMSVLGRFMLTMNRPPERIKIESVTNFKPASN